MLNKLLIILMISAFLAFDAKSQDKSPEPCKIEYNYKNLTCMEQGIFLIDNLITIRVYTKNPPKTNPRTIIDRTFVVVHANEEKGLDAAKKVISENYGRLVEVVSKSSSGKNQRYLYFGTNKENCVDPNRIYTKKGIKDSLVYTGKPCNITTITEGLINEIDSFAKKLLKIVTKNNTINFVIGIHNNDDSLSLSDWSNGDEAKSAFGVFKD